MYFETVKFNYYYLNNPAEISQWEIKIFRSTHASFNKLALEAFHFQFIHNTVYREFVRSMHIVPVEVDSIYKIPFIPISLFKTHKIKTTEFEEATVFESSGTTGDVTSRHYIRSNELYWQSFTKGFDLFYGSATDWCILGLLPSYLERNNSSLVCMMNSLILESQHPLSGFYLHEHEKLYHTLLHNEIRKQPTLLVGVSFALLDFVEKYNMNLKHCIVMETGGMKGRRNEITREELHKRLCEGFGLERIHSEYGMTELMSQAYSHGSGRFKTPPWMKVMMREEDDPLKVVSFPDLDRDRQNKPITGVINVIDLANIYSCCFIATDDVGKLHRDGTFEVLGRCDNSDIRGCSLML